MEKNKITTKAAILLSALAAAMVLSSCGKESVEADGTALNGSGSALSFTANVEARPLISKDPDVKAALINGDGSEPVALSTGSEFYVAGWDVTGEEGSETLTPAITPFEKVKYVTGSTEHVNMWITVNGSDDIIEHRWKSGEKKLFYAYSGAASGSASVEGATTDSPVLKVDCSLAAQTDVLMGYGKGDGKTGTEMTGTASVSFRHPLAAVAFELGTIAAPADMFQVTGITLEGLYEEGTAEMDKTGAISWNGCGGKGTLSGSFGDTFLAIPQTFTSDSSRVEISAKLGEKPLKLYIRLKGDSWEAGKITKYRINYDAHKGIQLWENGPYWATCNIGADYPEDYGWYFSWGNVEGFVPTDLTAAPGGTAQNAYSCTWKSVKDGHVLTGGFTPDNYAVTPGYALYNSDITDADHDAATKLLGAGWRMPRKGELDTLLNNSYTTRTEVKVDEVHYGYMFTGKGDYANRSIFLPAAGYGNGDLYSQSTYAGYYWSSVHLDIERSYSLHWNRAPGYIVNIVVGYDVRAFARTIRPVENF